MTAELLARILLAWLAVSLLVAPLVGRWLGRSS